MGPVAAAAPLILTAVGTAVGAFAQFQSMRSQAAMAEAAAKQAEENRRRAIYRGQIDAQDADFRAAQVAAELESQAAASGLDSTTGSAKDLVRKAQILGRLDSLRITQDSQVEGYNFGVEAATQRANAKNFRTAGTLALVGGAFGVAGDAASGIADMKKTDTLTTTTPTKNIISFKGP